MAFPFSVNQNQAVTHSNDPVTIIDYPQMVSIMEMGGAVSSAFGVTPITTYATPGTGISDDSAAINAAFTALAGTGISLFFPAGTYLCTTNKIVTQGVSVIAGTGAYFTGTYALTLTPTAPVYYARNVMTTVHTSTTYTGTGTNVLTFGSNATMSAQDGVTNAVGDVVILQGGTLGSCAITGADTGPWVVTSIGGASAKVVLTRPAWFQKGQIVPTLMSIKVGEEGTLFGGTSWTAWCTQGTTVIGTTDPAFYPDKVSTQVTLSSATVTLSTVPLRSATASQLYFSLSAATGTTTNTVAYGNIVAPTPGYVGTVSIVIDAIAAGMTKNGSADASIVNVLLINRA